MQGAPHSPAPAPAFAAELGVGGASAALGLRYPWSPAWNTLPFLSYTEELLAVASRSAPETLSGHSGEDLAWDTRTLQQRI